MKRHILGSVLVSLSLLFVTSCSSTGNDRSERNQPAVEPNPAPPATPGDVESQTPAKATPEATLDQPPASRPRANPAASTRPVVKAPKPPVATPPAVVAHTPEVPPAPVAAPPAPPVAETRPAPPFVIADVPPPPTTRQVTIPTGTLIPLRMIDSVSSKDGHVGETFRASLAEDVRVDDEVIIPSGAKATVKLVQVSSAGQLKGKSELKLELDSVTVASKAYNIQSDTYSREGAAQGERTARSVGIGAAIGAAVGAITGGKKGAVIGAGTGAGTGAVIEAARNEQIQIDSESRVDFHLEAPLAVTLPLSARSSSSSEYRSGPRSSRSASPTGRSNPDETSNVSRRSADDAAYSNISGEWKFTADGPQGTREGRIVFELEGSTLRGTIIDDADDRKLRGTVRGDSIRFITDEQVRGRIVQMEYLGTIDGDRMTGTVEMASASGGPRRSVNWTAERQ